MEKKKKKVWPALPVLLICKRGKCRFFSELPLLEVSGLFNSAATVCCPKQQYDRGLDWSACSQFAASTPDATVYLQQKRSLLPWHPRSMTDFWSSPLEYKWCFHGKKKKICTLKRGWLSVRTIACSQRTHCVTELSSWWWWCLLTCQQCSGRKSHVSSQERIQRGECWLDDSYALPVFLWMEIYWDVARCVLSEERSCVMLQAIFFSEIFICGDEGSKQY